jgi:hypothetical protein
MGWPGSRSLQQPVDPEFSEQPGSGRGGRQLTRAIGGAPGGSVTRHSDSNREAFTEGGTGLGVRSRGASERAAVPTEAGMGVMPVSPQEARRRKRRKGMRAEYLVEDEGIWVSGPSAGSGVVE